MTTLLEQAVAHIKAGDTENGKKASHPTVSKIGT